jgi:hypothetical protein
VAISVENPVRSARTDTAGRFEIRTLPSGILTVKVRRAGYQLLKRQVTLAPNGALELDLVLLTEVSAGGAAPP